MFTVYYLISLAVSSSTSGMVIQDTQFRTEKAGVAAGEAKHRPEAWKCMALIVNKQTEPLTRNRTIKLT